MHNMQQHTEADAQFVSIGWIARRWDVSRATAQRVLDRANLRPVFLTGARRGVKRYRRADVCRIEDGTDASAVQPR